MEIREREENIRAQFSRNKLKFDESTYYYSSREKEEAFINAQFKTPEELKKYKEYRTEWHRRANEMDAGSFPLAVICELVSFCNLRCEMCYTRSSEFQKSIIGMQRILPWDTVVRIIDECAELGVCSMLFSWRGESTLYRSKSKDGNIYDFADVLAYARKKGILEITSLTNGRALSDHLIEKIVRVQPNWISFSIDGLGDDYGKIRKSIKSNSTENPFDVVIDNLKKMVKIRDELDFTMPQIRTNTIYPPIAKDPEKYRMFMEGIGVGLVTVNEMLDFRGAELPGDMILDDWFCQYPFQRLAVSANGIVLPCPGSHNENDELILGRSTGSPKKSIIVNGVSKTIECQEMTLKQAWNSKKIEEIRELHRQNRRKEIWACKHCRHGAKKYGVTWIPEDWDMDKMEWKDHKWRT